MVVLMMVVGSVVLFTMNAVGLDCCIVTMMGVGVMGRIGSSPMVVTVIVLVLLVRTMSCVVRMQVLS